MTGQIVIAAYRPHTGKDEQLKELLKNHVPRLRRLNLATDRTPVLMQAANGTFIEVFEWASAEAIERAHEHPVVHTMWAEFEAVCDYESLSNLEEIKGLFPGFTPVEL
jgi:hypothetical protein